MEREGERKIESLRGEGEGERKSKRERERVLLTPSSFAVAAMRKRAAVL